MNYNNQELLDGLALEYILGTLQGQARKRFQRLLVSSAQARQTLWMWEQQLTPLAERLTPISPRPEVWQQITRRLGWQTEPSKAKYSIPLSWIFAAAASFFAVMLLLQPLQQGPTLQQVAILQAEDAKAWWAISKTRDQLSIRALSAVQPSAVQDYELWMLPADGLAPISLGLLPQSGMITVAVPELLASGAISALAVSLEPRGGSPLSVPSGPVLFVADIVTL